MGIPVDRKPERAVQAKVRDQSVRLCPVILSPAYQKKVCPSTTIGTSQVFFSNLRNRGNNGWSKQSDCSVLRGIRVSSVEEHNQYRSRLPQESPISFPQESWNPSPQAVSLLSQSTNASSGFILKSYFLNRI